METSKCDRLVMKSVITKVWTHHFLCYITKKIESVNVNVSSGNGMVRSVIIIETRKYAASINYLNEIS